MFVETGDAILAGFASETIVEEDFDERPESGTDDQKLVVRVVEPRHQVQYVENWTDTERQVREISTYHTARCLVPTLFRNTPHRLECLLDTV